MKQKKFQRRVLRVISEVKQTLNENNNAAKVIELATNFNVSRNSLQSAFLQECGESIRGYKLRIRMEQAMRMLEAEKDIKEIAITLNYTHSRNFSTAFKKYYGVVPTEWPAIVRNQSSLCESRPDKFGTP